MCRALLTSSAVVFTFACTLSSYAAPFVNLNFEQSTVLPTDPVVVPASAAFPGWTLKIGDTQSNFALHNIHGSGGAGVAIFDQPSVLGIPLLEGRFMALMMTDTASGVHGALEQLGDIPADTRSLQMLADGGRGPPIVSVSGTVVPMVFLSGIPLPGEPALFGGDVTFVAGTTQLLRIESGSVNPGRIVGVDDLRFSSAPIPEPWACSVATLLIVGSGQRRQRSKREGETNAIQSINSSSHGG